MKSRGLLVTVPLKLSGHPSTRSLKLITSLVRTK